MLNWNHWTGFASRLCEWRPAGPKKRPARQRRQEGSGLTYCQLEPRQMMAITLISDASLAPMHSSPGDFLDIPGITGGAFVAGLYQQGEIYSVSNTGQIVLHKISQDAGSYPSDLVHFKDASNVDWVYFAAQTKDAGRELFRLRPGIAASTMMVKDIYPGAFSSSPAELTVLGNKIFFSAVSEGKGRELWWTDGTSAGTVLAADIHPGATGSDPKHLVAGANSIHFSASSSGNGREYWRSNGTATVLVKDINPGVANSNPEEFVYTNGTIFFVATSLTHGREVWKSDGTNAGTAVLKNLATGMASSNPESLTVLGNEIFFTADAGGKGRELYRYIDVLQETVLVRDIIEGSGSSNPTDLTAVGSAVYFSAESPVYGRELWKSYGASLNTSVVRDIQVGQYGSNPTELANVNGTLYFQATLDGDSELWKSDGLGSNTVRVRNINTTGNSYPRNIGSIDNKAWFTADNGINGYELWTSGGTAPTTLMTELAPGTRGVQPSGFGSIGTDVIYIAHTSEGEELHKVNINGAITQLTQFDNGLDFDSVDGRESWMLLGNYYFFRHDDSNGGVIQLWKSNGTAAGTQMVTEITGSVNSVKWVQISGAFLYFSVEAQDGTVQLWRSSGFVGGTSRLREDVSFEWILRSVDVGGRVYFHASINGTRQLWRSDGTNFTTEAIPNITNPSGLMVKGSQVYFSATHATNGLNFIRILGNNAPVMIRPGLRQGNFSGINVGGSMYFSAYDETAGGASNYELWKSDGTTAGTIKLKEINTGGSSNPWQFREVNGKVFFTAQTATSGEELWVTDGTMTGTKQVKEIGPSSASGQVEMLAVHNNELYFKAHDGTSWHVWKSNGTAVGTIKLTEFANAGVYLNQLTQHHFLSLNNRLYFTFMHVAYGEELFYYT
jgi:ELWxxDGT repeat protein